MDGVVCSHFRWFRCEAEVWGPLWLYCFELGVEPIHFPTYVHRLLPHFALPADAFPRRFCASIWIQKSCSGELVLLHRGLLPKVCTQILFRAGGVDFVVLYCVVGRGNVFIPGDSLAVASIREATLVLRALPFSVCLLPH